MVYFSKTIQALTLKFPVITKFRESFQFVVCIFYANEVKHVFPPTQDCEETNKFVSVYAFRRHYLVQNVKLVGFVVHSPKLNI